MSEPDRRAHWYPALRRALVVVLVLLASCGNPTDSAIEITMRSRFGQESVPCTDQVRSLNEGGPCVRLVEEQDFQAADGRRATVSAHWQIAFFARQSRGDVVCGDQEFAQAFHFISDQNIPSPRFTFELELADGTSISMGHEREILVGDRGGLYFDAPRCYEAAGRWHGTSGDLLGRTGTYVWIYDSIQHTLQLEEDAASDENAASDQEEGQGPSFTDSDALEMVEAFYRAAEAGDAEAMRAVFSPGAVVSVDAFVLSQIEHLAQGEIYVDRACVAGDGEPRTIVVVCEYGDHYYLERVVGAPATPTTEVIIVTANGILLAETVSGSPYFPAENAFVTWMEENHPDSRMRNRNTFRRGVVFGDVLGSSIEEIRADAEVYRQGVDLWAAYLIETSCIYDDVGC